MTIYFEGEYNADFPFDAKEAAEKAILAVLDEENCPYEAEVSVTLTDDEEIRRINREQRDMDAATDVLSFPMVDYETPGDFSFLEECGEDCFHPESGELLLGDIVIAVPHVKKQAEEFGHSVLREYTFLIVHSMLHLLGYDHMVPEDASLMEEKQRIIMDMLQIHRC